MYSAHLALARLLRAVHRDVGAAHQVVGVRAGAGARGGEPDRGAHPARLAGDRDRLGQQRDDPVRDLLAAALVGVLEQHRELVAAQPRGQVGRTDAAADPLGGGDQDGVAGGVAGVVVDALEVVEVEEEHGAGAARAGQRLVQAAHEQRAVGEVGERVAVGLALERALQLAHAPDRLLQAVELQRHAGMAGERLEQPQVRVGEAGRGAEPVAEQHHADQARLAGHGRDHGLVDVVLRQVRRRAPAARTARSTIRARSSRRHARSAVASSCADGLHRLGGAAGAERGAQRQVAAGAEQDDLRRLHAERLARALQQVDQRGLDVGRAAERARDAVEELERLVLGVLGQVGAVGEHEHHGGRDDQPAGVPVLRHQRRAGQADARVRERDDEVGAEHAQHVHDGSLPSASAITDQHERGGHDGAGGDGDERRGPDARADLGRRGHQRVQHDDGQRRRQRELRDVERELDRLAAAHEQQHEDRAGDLGDDQLLGSPEQQADDQRQLRQRQRVRAAADVGVDDEDLGRGEAERERPPRDAEAVGVGRQVAHDGQVERDGGRGGQPDEQPDRGRAEPRDAAQPAFAALQSLADQLRPDQLRPDQLRPDQLRPVQPFSPVPTRGSRSQRLVQQVGPEDAQVEHGGLERLRRVRPASAARACARGPRVRRRRRRRRRAGRRRRP